MFPSQIISKLQIFNNKALIPKTEIIFIRLRHWKGPQVVK